MGQADSLRTYLLIGAGGFLGSLARYLVGVGVTQKLGSAWPWGTFLINLTGCFFIGLFFSYSAARGTAEAWRFLIPIGFIGAYTTFSTYVLEAVRLGQGGAWARAMSYVAASTIFGVAAIIVGMAAGKRLA